jgi:hypothetical protein
MGHRAVPEKSSVPAPFGGIGALVSRNAGNLTAAAISNQSASGGFEMASCYFTIASWSAAKIDGQIYMA